MSGNIMRTVLKCKGGRDAVCENCGSTLPSGTGCKFRYETYSQQTTSPQLHSLLNRQRIIAEHAFPAKISSQGSRCRARSGVLP
jgi:hypothetical protein